jgi:hypothetical protein
VFVDYGNAKPITSAGLLAKDIATPVFVRFSTVLGPQPVSFDPARDQPPGPEQYAAVVRLREPAHRTRASSSRDSASSSER